MTIRTERIKIFFPHLILPALTAAAIGFPLGLLKPGAEWWIILGLGSLLIVLVLLSEYISLEPTDIRYPLGADGAFRNKLQPFADPFNRVAFCRDQAYTFFFSCCPLYMPFSVCAFSTSGLGGPWRFQWSAVITLVVTQILDRALLLAAFAGAVWFAPFRPGVCHDRYRRLTGGKPRSAQCLSGTADCHGDSVDPGDLYWITAQPF